MTVEELTGTSPKDFTALVKENDVVIVSNGTPFCMAIEHKERIKASYVKNFTTDFVRSSKYFYKNIFKTEPDAVILLTTNAHYQPVCHLVAYKEEIKEYGKKASRGS